MPFPVYLSDEEAGEELTAWEAAFILTLGQTIYDVSLDEGTATLEEAEHIRNMVLSYWPLLKTLASLMNERKIIARLDEEYGRTVLMYHRVPGAMDDDE